MTKLAFFAVAMLTYGSAQADTLITQTGEGRVSVIQNLSAQECEKVRGKLLREDELEAQAKHDAANSREACPPDNASKEDWQKWHSEHLEATGCQTEGGGQMSWGGGIVFHANDVQKADCVK